MEPWSRTAAVQRYGSIVPWSEKKYGYRCLLLLTLWYTITVSIQTQPLSILMEIMKYILMAVMTAAIATGCTGCKSSQGTASVPTEPTESETAIVTTTQPAAKPTPVEIVDTCNLRIYYPNYSRIDLVCGEMPKKEDESVIMFAEAAFTGELLDSFNHKNIAGDHVSNGRREKGYRCKRNNGTIHGIETKTEPRWRSTPPPPSTPPTG